MAATQEEVTEMEANYIRLMQSHQDIRERLDDKDIKEKLLEEKVDILTADLRAAEALNVRLSEAVGRNEDIMKTDSLAFMTNLAEVTESSDKNFKEVKKDIEDNKNKTDESFNEVKKDIEDNKNKIDEMKQNFDEELSKIDGKLQTSTNEAKAVCREQIRDNNQSNKEKLDTADTFENTITDIREHFEQNKDHKDKVDREIRDVQNCMEQLLANAPGALSGAGQPPRVHYGQAGEDRSVS